MKKRFLLVLIVVFSASFWQCKKKGTNPPKRGIKAVKKVVKSAKKKTKAPKAQDSGKWLIGSYEKVRLALAADELGKAKSAAAEIAKEASSQKGLVKEVASGLASAAQTLAKAKDFAAARLAFGNLSRSVIAHIHNSEKLKKGIQAYTCPMAKGYKKWIQADANMANPYMGKRMLKCGGKTELKP